MNAEQKPAATAAAPKQMAVVLEVQGLGKWPLRLTECGALPMRNGDQIKVNADMALDLKARHSQLKEVEGPKEVASLKNGLWEPVKIAPGVTETAKAEPKAQENKPANKNMAGKAQTKA